MAEPQTEDAGRLTALPLPPDAPLLTRLKARRAELDRQTSELFDVPGYADTLLVELTPLPWEALDKIRVRVERETRQQPHMAALYASAEMILLATEGFHERLPDGRTQPAPEEASWVTFAKALNPTLGDDVRPRVALINMIGDMGVVLLGNEWTEWRRGDREVLERDLRSDFAPTG